MPEFKTDPQTESFAIAIMQTQNDSQGQKTDLRFLLKYFAVFVYAFSLLSFAAGLLGTTHTILLSGIVAAVLVILFGIGKHYNHTFIIVTVGAVILLTAISLIPVTGFSFAKAFGELIRVFQSLNSGENTASFGNAVVLMALPATALSYMFIVVMPMAYMLFFLAATFAAFCAARSPMISVIAFLAATFCSLILLIDRDAPRDYNRNANLEPLNGYKKMQKPDVFSGKYIFSVAVMIMAVITAVAYVLPARTFYSHRIDNYVSRLLGTKKFNNSTVAYKDFSLREVGFYPLQKRLGGKVKLDDTVFLQIETDPAPMYLKGTAYASYTGQMWLPESMNPNYLFGFYRAKDVANRVFGVADTKNKDFLRARKYTVKPQLIQQVIFNGGIPRSFKDKVTHKDLSAYFNMVGTLYLDHIVEPSGYEAEVAAYENSKLQSAQEFKRLMMAQEPETMLALPQDDLLKYLQLPEYNFYDAVRNLAPQLYTIIADPKLDSVDKAFAIKDYLQKNFTYSLDVTAPSENTEFTSAFLQQKKGYCTYFATTFAVLLRLCNIPCRYVEGFVVPAAVADYDDLKRDLKNSQAHAWVEVYFAGLGFVPMDATPQDYLDKMLGIKRQQEISQKIKNHELTTRPTTQIKQTGKKATKKSDEKLPKTGPALAAKTANYILWLYLAVAFAIFGFCFMIFLKYRLYRQCRSKRFLLELLQKHDQREVILAFDASLLYSLGFLNYKKAPSQTPREFYQGVENIWHDALKADYIKMLEDANYAKTAVFEPLQVAMLMLELRLAVDKQDLVRNGKFKFFVHEILCSKRIKAKNTKAKNTIRRDNA